MLKNKILLFLLLRSGMAFGQVNNPDDEKNALLSLAELSAQSFKEHYQDNAWDDGIRQHLAFDPAAMQLIFCKTPYDSTDNNKLASDIQWLTKFTIPLYEIDTLIGNTEQHTIAIKMKEGKSTIQSYIITSGTAYSAATKENMLLIRSDKLLKVRNLVLRMNTLISDLQAFYAKKTELVSFLNKALKQELSYQATDPLNYPEDRKFKVLQEFRIDSSGQWLSIIVERSSYYGDPIIEKQAVQLKDITGVLKDINIILNCRSNTVIKTTLVKTGQEAETESTGSLFFLQLCYEKNNEYLGDEIIRLCRQIGLNAEKTHWYD